MAALIAISSGGEDTSSERRVWLGRCVEEFGCRKDFDRVGVGPKSPPKLMPFEGVGRSLVSLLDIFSSPEVLSILSAMSRSVALRADLERVRPGAGVRLIVGVVTSLLGRRSFFVSGLAVEPQKPHCEPD